MPVVSCLNHASAHSILTLGLAKMCISSTETSSHPQGKQETCKLSRATESDIWIHHLAQRHHKPEDVCKFKEIRVTYKLIKALNISSTIVCCGLVFPHCHAVRRSFDAQLNSKITRWKKLHFLPHHICLITMKFWSLNMKKLQEILQNMLHF